MTDREIEKRFEFHPADTDQKVEAHRRVRSNCRYLAQLLSDFLPECRETSLAITHLEEVMMWANAAIARNMNPKENENG